MAPRAIWKGMIEVEAVSCPVALYSAASAAERIAFHTLNRQTGNRVHRQYVDAETGEPVGADEQVKGYETAKGGYVTLDAEDLAAAVPEVDKRLEVEAFVDCDDIDDTFLDRPYYLAPANAAAVETFALLRDGMRKKGVAALARALLFRRVRTLLIRVEGAGMIATTLNFDYEVRSAAHAFAGISKRAIEGEMLELARHIIATKTGTFDASKYDDRYENALAELVRAKLEGRKLKAPPKPKPTAVNDLMAALRQSAATVGKAEPKGRPAAKRKAG